MLHSLSQFVLHRLVPSTITSQNNINVLLLKSLEIVICMHASCICKTMKQVNISKWRNLKHLGGGGVNFIINMGVGIRYYGDDLKSLNFLFIFTSHML